MQNKFVDGCDLFAKDFQREKDAEVANYVEYLDEIMNIRINSFTDFLRFNLISKHVSGQFISTEFLVSKQEQLPHYRIFGF